MEPRRRRTNHFERRRRWGRRSWKRDRTGSKHCDNLETLAFTCHLTCLVPIRCSRTGPSLWALSHVTLVRMAVGFWHHRWLTNNGCRYGRKVGCRRIALTRRSWPSVQILWSRSRGVRRGPCELCCKVATGAFRHRRGSRSSRRLCNRGHL